MTSTSVTSISTSALPRVSAWDLHWCLRLNRYASHPRVAAFFRQISRLGNGRFWYVLALLLAIHEGPAAWPLLQRTLLTALLGVLIYKLLKQRTLRPRPYQVHQAVVMAERPLDHFSFPSGHTLHAVLLTILLGHDFPWLLPVLVPFAVLVAVSRPVLGLHYPTDVLAGAALGGLLATGSLLLGT